MGARGAAKAGVVAAVLAAGGVLGGLAAGQDEERLPDFAWTMPPRYGAQVEDGLIRYPQSAPEVTAGPYEVDFHLPREACESGSRVEFTVAGEELAVERLGPDRGVPAGECVFRSRFEREGSYDVELHVSGNGRDERRAKTVVVQDLLIVAIGDSVASGEGNPIRRGVVRPAWQNERCHRSSLASTALSAQHIENANGSSSVTFVHLACSGATVPVGLTGRYRGAKRRFLQRPALLPPQLAELRTIAAQREVDAVLLSVGGNDAGFADIVKFCGARDDCERSRIDPRKLGLPAGAALPLEDAIPRTLARLPARFAAVARGLPETLPAERVHLIEYLDATHASADAFCDEIEIPPRGIDRGELRWAFEDVIAPLNARLRAAADAHAWRYVAGVADGYRGHGYCTADRWVRRLGESLADQGLDPRGTLHPNEAGHRFTMSRILSLLEPALLPSGIPRAPVSPDRRTDAVAGEGVVPADLADEPALDEDDGPGFVAGFAIGFAVAAALVVAVALLRRRR